MTWIKHIDIGKSIKDEFTELPISRQRKHQLRNPIWFKEVQMQKRIKTLLYDK